MSVCAPLGPHWALCLCASSSQRDLTSGDHRLPPFGQGERGFGHSRCAHGQLWGPGPLYVFLFKSDGLFLKIRKRLILVVIKNTAEWGENL